MEKKKANLEIHKDCVILGKASSLHSQGNLPDSLLEHMHLIIIITIWLRVRYETLQVTSCSPASVERTKSLRLKEEVHEIQAKTAFTALLLLPPIHP